MMVVPSLYRLDFGGGEGANFECRGRHGYWWCKGAWSAQLSDALPLGRLVAERTENALASASWQAYSEGPRDR